MHFAVPTKSYPMEKMTQTAGARRTSALVTLTTGSTPRDPAVSHSTGHNLINIHISERQNQKHNMGLQHFEFSQDSSRAI